MQQIMALIQEYSWSDRYEKQPQKCIKYSYQAF